MSFLEHDYSPVALGINNVTLPSAVGSLDSAAIATNDCDLLTLHIYGDYVAATDVRFNVKSYDHMTNTWHVEQTVAISAGAATYSDFQGIKAITADKYWKVSLDVSNTRLVKLTDIFGTGATTDKITISAVARQVV